MNQEVMTMAKAKSSQMKTRKKKEPAQSRQLKRFATLLLKDTGATRQDGIDQLYELLPIPLGAAATGVEDFNVGRKYNADATPQRRAVGCITFFNDPSGVPHRERLQEILAYIANTPDYDENHPLQREFDLIQYVAGRMFDAALKEGKRLGRAEIQIGLERGLGRNAGSGG